MTIQRFKLTALAIALCGITGCSVTHDKHLIEQASSDANGTARYRATLQAESISLDAKRAAQTVQRPFITGRAVPVSREVTLPMPLRQGVDTTLLYSDGAVDLPTLAARIQNATQIPVQVMPDALLPVEDFLPRLNERNESQQSQTIGYPTSADLADPTAYGLDPSLANDFLPTGTLNASSTHSGKPQARSSKARADQATRPLDATLDSIATKLFVSWKYDSDRGAIVFYRTDTRIFEVRNLEESGSTEMSAGQSGSTDGSSASNGLESRSKSVIKSERKEQPMAGLIKRVEQFMTRAGQATAGDDGYLVVTDTKAALDKIDAYIRMESAMRSRRIDFVYEQITVERTDSQQGALNWNLAFQTASTNGFEVSGLNSIVEQQGAAMSIGLSAGSGQFAGSSVAVQALSKIGRVVSQRMDTFGSTNGQPSTVGRPKRLSYIDKLDQTPNTSLTTAPTLSMSTKELVYGRLITFLPYAYSNGDINLSIKFDDTPKPDIERISQPNGSYVQNPQIQSDVYVRKAILRPGQPYVIAAQTEDSQSSDERRTDRKASIIMGGSDTTQSNQRITVSVITAMVREQ
ncbi:hypothetical protein NJC40_00045 [Pseudomonas sp. 21LCFQ02]|uniref:hypothetical protein n=1 Tax=Pseudomonas sp. 21LCFQ02 TaxID=2957505 RepID=UPI00209AC38E|nr:hypothetical protein [Pseudomonas sp. 21LCFQ02]MCO8166173.1 hypothetical protein [Pseudomonas sp. 21LCFQ02]